MNELKFLIISKIQPPPVTDEMFSGGRKKIINNEYVKNNEYDENNKIMNDTKIINDENRGIHVIKDIYIETSVNVILDELNIISTNLEEKDRNGLKMLIAIFEFIKFAFLSIKIEGISAMEIFNNSIIEDATTVFILNGCKYNDNIFSQVEIILSHFVSATTTKEKVEEVSEEKAVKVSEEKAVKGGAGLTPKIYNANTSLWAELDRRIAKVKVSILFELYTEKPNVVNDDYEDVLDTYREFIKGIEPTITLITGPKLYESYNKDINALHLNIIYSLSKRNSDVHISNLLISVTTFVFDKIIIPYEDVKNKVKATIDANKIREENKKLVEKERQRREAEAEARTDTLNPTQVDSVQNISRLVVYKVLELTGFMSIESGTDIMDSFGKSIIPTSDNDLNAQIQILFQIIKQDKSNAFLRIDEDLLKYFTLNYSNKKDNGFIYGEKGNTYLERIINKNKKNKNFRVINNAIPSCPLKNLIEDIVVCPTSSVCDAMGSFGSCLNPSKDKQEYYNMDFYISSSSSSANYYLGDTTIKYNAKKKKHNSLYKIWEQILKKTIGKL